MIVTPGIAVVLFALGMALLSQLALTFAQVNRLYRLVRHAEQDLFTLIERRMERLPQLIRTGDDVRGIASDLSAIQVACNAQRNAVTLTDRVEAAQAVHRAIATLISRADTLGLMQKNHGGAFVEVLLELQEQEPFLNAARERFNQAAVAWNTNRRLFPNSILAGARGLAEIPVFSPYDR
jgi:hypothetical protein